jgi:hypothetical protein
VPFVELQSRQWQSKKFGLQSRPHFQIVGWPGSGAQPALSKPKTITQALDQFGRAEPPTQEPPPPNEELDPCCW